MGSLFLTALFLSVGLCDAKRKLASDTVAVDAPSNPNLADDLDGFAPAEIKCNKDGAVEFVTQFLEKYRRDSTAMIRNPGAAAQDAHVTGCEETDCNHTDAKLKEQCEEENYARETSCHGTAATLTGAVQMSDGEIVFKGKNKGKKAVQGEQMPEEFWQKLKSFSRGLALKEKAASVEEEEDEEDGQEDDFGEDWVTQEIPFALKCVDNTWTASE